MLLPRILTALVLIPLVILAIFKLPAMYFSLFIAIITLLAAWEWTNLIGLEKLTSKLLLLLALILPMLVVQFWSVILDILAEKMADPEIRYYSGVLDWLVVFPVAFWIVMMLLIRSVPDQLLKLELSQKFKAFTGVFLLFFAWMFLTRLRSFYGPEMVTYFLVLIWAADVSAYFVGKKFGKDKLVEIISPGKTLQGMYGALAAGLVCGLGLRLFYPYPLMILADFTLLSVLTVLISIYGDLFFSLVKRQAGVKDSGTLLPGHGGVLDRIDSIIAAAPFFYAGIWLIGRSVFA
jgi:phosphatidate cytidylyltransferase